MDYPGPQLQELRPSDDIRDNPSALEQRLLEDGYLYLPGLLNRDHVLAARERTLSFMASKMVLDPAVPVLEGVMPRGGRGVNMMGRKELTHTPEFLAVLEAPELFRFFRDRFGEEARTFDYKWMRAVGNDSYTGCHYDVVYMGLGSQRLHTVWIPFEDVEVERGTLAVCEGSHNLVGFQRLRETYGRMDVDRDLVEGWFSEDPAEIRRKFGGQWRTSPVRAGDVILFGLWMMHASTTNVTNRWRLSCDVRYLPASEPADARWMGVDPKAHAVAWAAPAQKRMPMAEARKAWGV
jgi:hypothetical protein